MLLTESHTIAPTHPFWGECDDLCWKSKNLYNAGLYSVRQHWFETKSYLSYPSNYHRMKPHEAYAGLPAKVSNQTLRMVDQNFQSFFGLLKTQGGTARIPKYLDITKGRYLVKYEKQALGKRHFFKTGTLLLSQTQIEVKTKVTDWDSIREVRIVPRGINYRLEVVYEQKEKVALGSLVAAVDPGLNNLATVTYSDGRKPLIINGRPLKSMNQYWNKTAARLKAQLEKEAKCKTSKKLTQLNHKRNAKVADYMHKASRMLVNQLVSNGVGTLILGKNVGQKQDINLGKTTNQNFTQIPTFRFLGLVAYKARLEGIEVRYQEESYTSKASFLNLDPIPVWGDDVSQVEFSGYRESRGVYKVKGSIIRINADVNASYNIMRKAVPNVFAEGIEAHAVVPRAATPQR